MFVAGATGAIGRELVPLLVKQGDDVIAMTRSTQGAEAVSAMGADVVLADAVDGAAVTDAVMQAANPNDYGGNSVFLRIGPDRYACYAHLKPGSVLVRRGQRVRVGQPIGLVGNSGNTDAPHLHFGIQRRAGLLSESEPFEIDHYTLEGTVDPKTSATHVIISGPRRDERRSHPLIRSVITLLPSQRPGHVTVPTGLG